ncbi:MAG: DNA cytosine methyltransferase [Sphaerochaeta sp.]|uniref:DNA cytosine methyltransferase n=1 Tax=Sphaerochaeta sp. TaxID=1972642 RepID=UPI003D127D50
MKQKPLVIDLFAGAGGESQGIHWAMGLDVELFAVNHWEVACETHAKNFPSDVTICQDVQTVIPADLTKGRDVEILWASPECTHHSVARGGKPMDDQSRCTPFDIPRWLTMANVKRIIIENVPEYVNWGPLGNDYRPIQNQKGLYFKQWVKLIEGLGYTVEWKIINSADIGTHTARRRFYLQGVKNGSGKKIVWPTPTNAKEPDMFHDRWLPASEIIDWSQPKSPISLKPRPLAESTMQKIVDGIQKFWTKDQCEPFIARFNSGKNRVHSINEPLPVLDCSNRYALVEPIVMGYYGNATFTPVSQPLPTITTKERFALLEGYSVDGKQVHDVSLRMLTVKEMQLAQSFPASYQFTGSKADAVRQIGNAVCPRVAEALVRA